MSLLKVTDLKVSYGGIEALKGVSFAVKEGEIVTLIGANGAGKSTALRSISGLVSVKGGTIEFGGENITGMDPQKIVSRGIAMVPEGRRVFPNLTVVENLKIGAYLRKDEAGIRKDMDHVYDLFPRLKERSWQMAGTLSGGEQQMLAVGRAMMARPKLMMMDEPSLGLAPLVVRDIFHIIRQLSAEGIHTAHRAKRQRRPQVRQLRLRAGNRRNCHGGQGDRIAGRPARARRLSGRSQAPQVSAEAPGKTGRLFLRDFALRQAFA